MWYKHAHLIVKIFLNPWDPVPQSVLSELLVISASFFLPRLTSAVSSTILPSPLASVWHFISYVDFICHFIANHIFFAVLSACLLSTIFAFSTSFLLIIFVFSFSPLNIRASRLTSFAVWYCGGLFQLPCSFPFEHLNCLEGCILWSKRMPCFALTRGYPFLILLQWCQIPVL